MADSDNKRIAINTFFMYFRMLLVMGVTLFTSRVVLQQLGVDDYGIYSVIGGVVTLFTFLNQAMSTSTQRFITYELGKVNGNVCSIFTACVKLHIWMAMGIVMLAETVGLWFVNNKMVFPEGSMTAVYWTYQLSILNCVIGVFKVPYNALVISYERMSFYAYNSIVEVVLKLLIVYLLMLTTNDKLVLYVAMLAVISLFMTIWYVIYCYYNFPKVKFVKVTDRNYYRKILAFSGWATFGSIAGIGFKQGIVVVINMFYGVVANAAVGIANQVNRAILQFVGGFQQALNPQLIKSEASQNTERQMTLIMTSSKISFLIMLLIAYPIICNIEYILKLWLGEYPPYTPIVTTLVIVEALIDTLSGPLWVSIFATGKIRSYQIVISSITILAIPIAYIIGMSDLSLACVFVMKIVVVMISIYIRLVYLRKLIQFSISEFVTKVLFRLLPICIILLANYWVFHVMFTRADGFIMLFVQSSYFLLITLLTVIFIGLNKKELQILKNMTLSKFK